MAKKIKVSVTDFLEKTLGMSASAESMRMEHTSRRRNTEIYSKPMNPYRLAKDLADIQADQYRQHAESVTATAMSEAAVRGYGELSVQDVTDRVTEGAKNAWKSFLVLVDKLISVIKEFIRGLFDKEKKINDVMKKVKAAIKRVPDSSRIDSSKEIKVAELSDQIYGFLGKGEVDYKPVNGNGGRTRKTYVSGKVLSSYINALIDGLAEIKSLRKGDDNGSLIGSFIVNTITKAQSLNTLKSQLKSGSEVNLKGETVKGNYTEGKVNPDDIDLKEYKEDWNNVIKDFNAITKSIVKDVKKVDKSAESSDTSILVVRKISRTENNAKAIRASLDSLYDLLNGLKNQKINSKLEKCISALNELRQAIIRNKDGRFSNKYAQLGRVTISKITIVYTKTIAIMNSIYTICFKAAGINISAVNSLMQKDTNTKRNDETFRGPNI